MTTSCPKSNHSKPAWTPPMRRRTSGGKNTTPRLGMVRRIKRFALRWCDQLKLLEFWLFVVGGILISASGTYWVLKSDFAEHFAKLQQETDNKIAIIREDADKRVKEMYDLMKGGNVK